MTVIYSTQKLLYNISVLIEEHLEDFIFGLYNISRKIFKQRYVVLAK